MKQLQIFPHNTPLSLSKTTKISRPAIYAILKSFKKRGLADVFVKNQKKYWRINTDEVISGHLYDTRKAIFRLPEGKKELHGLLDSSVTIYRNKATIKKVISTMFDVHRNEKLYGYQGNVSEIGWDKIFSVQETNYINRQIKKNHILVDAILPSGWFERQVREMGVDWAKDFEGRTTGVNIISPEFFKHGGQVWMFKNSLYLFALNEEIVIEVKNSEIQKMVLALFNFIQENSKKIDANNLLRNLVM